MSDRRVSRLKNDSCNTAKPIRYSVKLCKIAGLITSQLKLSKNVKRPNKPMGGGGGNYKPKNTSLKIEMGKNDITQSKIAEIAFAPDTTPEYLMGLTSDASKRYKDEADLVVPNPIMRLWFDQTIVAIKN